jgi:hypothetical protein
MESMPGVLKSLKIRSLERWGESDHCGCVTVELLSSVYTTVQIVGLHKPATPKMGSTNMTCLLRIFKCLWARVY